MHLLTRISFLSLIPVPVLTTTTTTTTIDNDNMERVQPDGVRRDDAGPVKTSLLDTGDDNKAVSLHSDEGDKGRKAVLCRSLLLGDCCQGRVDELLFDSTNNNQAARLDELRDRYW